MPRVGRGEGAFVVACLALFATLAISSMRVKSPTFDESAHLAAGISYVQARDFRMNPEHPALPKLLAGAAATMAGARADTTTDAWARADQWEFARETLYAESPGWRRVLFAGRLPMVALGVLLGLLVWRWTRSMVGGAGAAVALGLYTFSPTFLAHTRLVTTDVPLTLTVVGAVACLWKARATGSARWIVAAAGFVALSMVTKFSAFSYAPVYAVLAVLPGERRTVRAGALHLGVLALASFVLTELLVFVCYGFATEFVTIRAMGMEGRGVRPETMSRLRRIPFEAIASVPWPSRDFAQGLKDIVLYTEAGHPVYALGMRSDRGWWWAPLLMLAVKLPLPLLVLSACGMVATAVSKRLRTAEALFFVLPIALVVATNVAANLGLGVRHLAPAIPFLAAAAAWPLRGAGVPLGLATLAAYVALSGAQAVGVLRAHPHYLSYFHVLAGGPRGGARLLGDSNLDWGQDLSLAAEELRERGVDRAILCYFGTADPFAEEIEWQLLPPTARARDADPWAVLPAEGPQWLVMSVTNLQGVYSRLEGRDVPYPWLMEREPEVVVGGSIYLYEIGQDADVQKGLASAYRRYGMAREWENALERAIAARPDDVDVRGELVQVLVDRGDVEGANALVIAAPNPTADEIAGVARRQWRAGDGRGADETYALGVRTAFPDDLGLKNDYAWFLQETGGDLDVALDLASHAATLEPHNAAYLDTRGMVHWKRGDAWKALEDFDAALALPGGDVPEIRWHRVRALASAGRRHEADAEARKLLVRTDAPDSLREFVAKWLTNR